MNKVQVGFAPSPNLKTVHSKIGSLANANYKPGGGHVKIESKKIQIEAKPRIGARNENYTPSGGDVKVNIFLIKHTKGLFPLYSNSQVSRVEFIVWIGNGILRPIANYVLHSSNHFLTSAFKCIKRDNSS